MNTPGERLAGVTRGTSRGRRVYQTRRPLETSTVTDRLSSTGARGQHPVPGDRPAVIPLASIHAFDLHVEDDGGPATLPLPGGPRGDDDRGDDFPDDSNDDDNDDPPPANAGAVGVPCHSDTTAVARPTPAYTLCGTIPDPRDLNDIRDGQELIYLETREMAFGACDEFAPRPAMLASKCKVDMSRWTHLSVFDAKGNEVRRRAIVAA